MGTPNHCAIGTNHQHRSIPFVNDLADVSRLFKRVGTLLAVALVASVFAMPLAAQGITRARVDPAPNPDLEKSCGLDILMILDESGSIQNAHATDDVRDAFKAFTAALNNTSSSIAVAEFSTVARLPSIGAFGPGDYITITDSTKPDLDSYVDNDYDPDGSTNWEDALRMGIPNHAERPDPVVPHLTVLITDGDPNRVIREWRVTEDEYANKVPLSSNEVTRSSKNAAADAAVPNANLIKAQGSHILAIAVGNGLSGGSALNRLEKLSGPDIYDGSGTFDISTHDIYREPDFRNLQDALRDAAFQLCAPSVTIQKLVDLTPDPNSLDDAVPGVGWEVTGTPTAAGGFDWVLPDATPAASKTDLTDNGGFAQFQWTTNAAVDSAFTATETPQAGFSNLPNETSCTYRTPDLPDTVLTLDSVAPDTFSTTIPPESIVVCTFFNLADPVSAIDIEKSTNHLDADTAPGPGIRVGKPVEWTYVVTNTGNLTLSNVVVTDDDLGATADVTVDCPKTTLLHGESMVCTALGVSGTNADGGSLTGLYSNEATVTATDTRGGTPSDSDPSHYTVTSPDIHLIKEVSLTSPEDWQDANSPPGPFYDEGDSITFRYSIENTGTETLTDIDLSDSVLGDLVLDGVAQPGVNCVWPAIPEGFIDPGESVVCTVDDTAQADQYDNLGTVSGTEDVVGGVTVTDTDPAHYFGANPSVDIEKSTNGEDADTAPGPTVAVGDTIHWSYEVTNNGNVPLVNWSVEDDQLGTVSCPRIVLKVGASTKCYGTGTAAAGQYENEGTVTAQDPAGGPDVTDSDLSHYFAAEPGIDIEKATNTQDADAAPGPYVQVGGPVTWSYEVTNPGNIALSSVSVVDDQGLTLTFIGGDSNGDSLLDINETWIYEATGFAVLEQYENLATATATGPFGPVSSDDPSHYFGVESGVSIEKFTNGLDSDTAPGGHIPVGDPVEWTYLVTNTGNDELTNVQVVDNIGGPVTCPGGPLAPGASVACDPLTGTANSGRYANLATVTATDVVGAEVTDDDPSHYFGYLSEIHVEKSTNGDDADTPNGPFIKIGDPVAWTYEVTNPGDTDIHNVSVTDDQGVTPSYVSGDDGDGILQPGETWVYEATGTATEGQYANLATAAGVDEFEDDVTDDDPSHYFGVPSGIDVEKSTNGEDADTPTGPSLMVGEEVTWTYEVTNIGALDVANVVVADDQGVTPVYVSGDDGDGILQPGEIWVYEATGTAVEGQYANVATATGIDEADDTVADTDPSHYIGLEASIQIEKTPDTATVPYYDSHEFTITVTNTGDTVLTEVEVTDPVTPSCDRAIGTMNPGEVVVYTCTVDSVEAPITNVAFVEGIAPDGTTRSDDDDARVDPFEVAGTAMIGDTAFWDTNGNRVQDAGEEGIPGARVTVRLVSSPSGATFEEVYTTDANGNYLAVALLSGTYGVTVDTTSVNGTLTTVGTFSVDLEIGETYLDADFGFQQADFPLTGTDSAAQAWLAVILLGAGVMLVVGSHRWRQQPDERLD